MDEDYLQLLTWSRATKLAALLDGLLPEDDEMLPPADGSLVLVEPFYQRVSPGALLSYEVVVVRPLRRAAEEGRRPAEGDAGPGGATLRRRRRWPAQRRSRAAAVRGAARTGEAVRKRRRPGGRRHGRFRATRAGRGCGRGAYGCEGADRDGGHASRRTAAALGWRLRAWNHGPLYRQWHGDPDSPHPPLLLIHGGGSTIRERTGACCCRSSRRARPVLAGSSCEGHLRRTPAGDRPAPSFEGSAATTSLAVLTSLGLGPVDVLGFSNGGQVALRLAARHPSAVLEAHRGLRPGDGRAATVDSSWDGLAAGDLRRPSGRVSGRRSGGQPRSEGHARRMFELDRELMLGCEDFPDDLLASIAAPALIVGADHDVVRASHFVERARHCCRTPAC
ncbi:alpha/beta fold hydrolase [Caulobacter segnis]